MTTLAFEPNNRESTIANDVGEKAKDHPEWNEGDRMLVLYKGPEDAVIAMFGYGEEDYEKEGLLDLLVAMAAVLEAHGHDPNILLEAFKDKLPK